MKKILFVDDEPNVLQGLRRMLRPLRNEWEMEFVESGEEALKVMEEEGPFDVVVADMRMPGMDGAELLTRVMKTYPDTVRIVLSGHSDKEMVLRTVGPAHQYLAKPSDADTIKQTVLRTCALRCLLAEDSLKRMVAGISSLPSLPSLFLELTQALRSPEVSVAEVGEIISRDVGMSAKILQLVNSAFFGLRRHVSSPADAASLLGLDTIKALVLTVGVFDEFDDASSKRFSPESLWYHSMLVGTSAKKILQSESKERTLADNAFMAGLLHDVGKLILASKLPEQFDQALLLAEEERIPLCQAESRIFGTTHAEIGAYLLGLWGLQDPVVEALAFHHYPSAVVDSSVSPLTGVHVANVFSHTGDDAIGQPASTPLDTDYIERLGLGDRISAWREICQQVSEVGKDA